MIALDAVRFRYEDMVMDFTLAVPRDCLMAIIGPSGAGKSTLLGLIAGFEAPLSGTLRIAGRDMAGIAPADRPVSMVFQDNNSFAHLTVRDNVGLGLSPHLRLDAAGRAEVATALERVGLEGLAERRPGELSGGERQRIAIARALVRRKPVLLLDEPFTALGPALRREMLDLIVAIQRERGLTVLMVTHQPEDARQAAQRIAFVNAGRVSHVMETARFFATDAPPDIAAYLRG